MKFQRALSFIADSPPSAIIITDAILATHEPTLNTVREKLVEYVHTGGTAIVATHFACFARPSDVNNWFQVISGLPWKSGDYHRTTVYLNKEHCGLGDQRGTTLHGSYSQKAVFLENVSKEAAVYFPSTSSRIESLVFSPSPVDQTQTPVAFVRVGEGFLGYIGDVNGEIESDAVILAMCGI